METIFGKNVSMYLDFFVWSSSRLLMWRRRIYTFDFNFNVQKPTNIWILSAKGIPVSSNRFLSTLALIGSDGDTSPGELANSRQDGEVRELLSFQRTFAKSWAWRTRGNKHRLFLSSTGNQAGVNCHLLASSSAFKKTHIPANSGVKEA